MTKSVKKASAVKGKSRPEIVLATADPKIASQIAAAVGDLSGSGVQQIRTGKDLIASTKRGEGFLLLDNRLPDWNAYELCRHLKSMTRFRVIMLLHEGDRFGTGISRFCGADGTLALPAKAEALEELLRMDFPEVRVDELLRKAEQAAAASFPEALLKDATGEQDRDLVEAIIDPETKLFNYAFLSYKLDEEFKRATRFKYPLACVMLGFDGEASADVLLDLSSIFLTHSRDTDVLGRFDLSSFLFLLPNTGLAGARTMAERVLEACNRKKLKDLVGEPLELSVGISICPHSSIAEREDLFEAAKTAFEKASIEGGGIEIADAKF